MNLNNKGDKIMTKKHYIKIAKIIKDSTIVTGDDMIYTINKTNLVIDLCKVFKQDNALFNNIKFIDACDVVEH